MIRVAVVGFGYWGPNFCRVLLDSREFSLRAIVDPDPERREAARRRCRRVASSLAELPTVDAVVIATPVSTHYELARAALVAGKHVLVTKPLAASVAEAEELAEIAKERGLVLLVDHTFVYTGAVRKIGELAEADELGEPLYFDSVRVNLGLFQHDVDVIWDLAPHDLSILDSLLDGELPVDVSAVGAAPVRGGHVELAYLTLRYGGDVLAHVHVNWLSPVKVRRLLIGATRKMIVYDDMEPTEKVRVYDTGVELRDRFDVYAALVDYRTGDMVAPKLDSREALAVEASHFAACIRGEEKPISGAHAGVRIVRILEAATRSLAAEGDRVPV